MNQRNENLIPRVLVDLCIKGDKRQLEEIGQLFEDLYDITADVQVQNDSAVLGEIGTLRDNIADFVNHYVDLEFAEKISLTKEEVPPLQEMQKE